MNTRLKIKLGILLLLVITLVFAIYLSFKENGSKLTVAFLNIGQGDAIFIEAPSGNQLLIDGGPGKTVLRELSQVMPFYDHSIDIVMATHPDADHIGGLPDVLERYKTDLFLEPGVEGDTNVYKELESKVKSLKIKRLKVRRGMVVDLGEGTLLQILFPVTDPEGMETNTASIVARLIYGEHEFLLTGDSPKNIEEYLTKESCKGCPFALEADVLKAGHHGSKTSTSDLFVRAVAPKYAVISAGRDNRYGHPHQEVLDTLTQHKIQILRTDQSGTIIFKGDGVNLELKNN